MAVKGLEPEGRAPSHLRVLLTYRDFFDVPFGAGATVEDIVALGVERVDDASRLSVAQAGLRPPEQLPGMIHLIELAVAVSAVKIFRSDLNGPWRSDPGDGFFEVQIEVIDLDAEVAAVGDINQAGILIH